MEALLDAGDREIARLGALDPDGTSLTTADLAGILRITREFHAELNEGCNNPVVSGCCARSMRSTWRPCRATCRSRSATAAALKRPSATPTTV